MQPTVLADPMRASSFEPPDDQAAQRRERANAAAEYKQVLEAQIKNKKARDCLLYTSPSPRD